MNPNEHYTIEHRRYYDDEGDVSEYFDLKVGANVSYQFVVHSFDSDGGWRYELALYKDNDFEDVYGHYKFDDYGDMCAFILATAGNLSFSCPSF